MKNWFKTEKIDKYTYSISEPYHWEETNCYLLIGEEKALLIDTGLGISGIFREASKFTDKPIIAVPTHVHWDHIGGLPEFSEFYVHEEEYDWINGKFPLSADFVMKELVKFNTLPDAFEADNYTVFQGEPKLLLKDGDVIDIGGRAIKVLHTPGHSPGHICFWEEQTGYLFTGDLIYKGTLYANYPSTDPVKFLNSVEKISGLAVKKILPAHHSMDISLEIIDEIRFELKKLKNENKLFHGSGMFSFNEWSIML